MFYNLVSRRSFFHASDLSNGLKVALVNSPASFDAVGLLFDYKNNNVVADIKDRLSCLAFEKALFKGNARVTEGDLLSKMDEIIGTTHSRVGREGLLLGGAVSPDSTCKFLSLLNDLFSSAPLPLDHSEFKRAIEFDFLDMKTKRLEDLLADMAVSSAYPEFGSSTVLAYNFFTAGNDLNDLDFQKFFQKIMSNPVTLIGLSSWTNHTDFVKMANDLLSDLPLSLDKAKKTILKGDHNMEKPKFNEDGQLRIPDVEMPLTHMAISYPGLSATDPMSVTGKVMQRLLGGGGSFSAGGPGKGMYARLYTSLLNRHHWLESAKCFNQQYSTCGVFGIYGSATPGYAKDLFRVLTGALVETCSRPITDEELERAKAQVKSMAFMDNEIRLVQLNDVSDQLMFTNKVTMPGEYAEAVDRVTKNDIQSLASRLFTGKHPNISIYGALPSVF